MSEAAGSFNQGVRRVVISQLVLSLITAGAFAIFSGWLAAGGALYGGAIAVISALWMGYRIRRAGGANATDLGSSATVIYGGAVVKFIFAIAAFAIGMGVLKLPPLPVIAGFAVTQLAYLLVPMRMTAPSGSKRDE